MRSRFCVVVLAIAAMVSVMVHPAVAQAEPAAGPPVTSCSAPPDTAGATPDNRDRFVKLWSARFADTAWRKDFIELSSVPADIRAEGFHDLPKQTQLWLSACLVDDLVATAGIKASAQDRETWLSGVLMVVFGKPGVEKMRDELNEPAEPAPAGTTPPVKQDLTADALADMSADLSEAPSTTPQSLPKSSVAAPRAKASANITAGVPASFNTGLASLPLVPTVLSALDALLQEVSKVQGKLFTLPVVNLLSPLFYKICAEAPGMPLKCSVSVPVAVPVPADVNGDNFPDVLAQLTPQTNISDVGAKFSVSRLLNSGPLPTHVFAVYDTPVVKKRVTVGFDGRGSTLGKNNAATFTLKNIVAALTGDIQVEANLKTTSPGTTEALTFAVKSLVGGSSGVLPTEEDPLTGSVQLSPFPEDFTVGARLTHGATRSQDTITVNSPITTRVDAVIDQAVTSGLTDSKRRFTAAVDKLPSNVRIDLVREGKHQNIEYTADSEIDLVEATDTTTPDVTKPAETDHAVYQVHGVPKHMQVDLNGNLIVYDASDTIDKVYAGVDRMGGDQLIAEVNDIPSHATVTFDGKNSILDWDAVAPTTSAIATAHLTAATLDIPEITRDFDAALTIDSIPAKWNANWANGNVVFDAPEAGIGSITANVTNHETFSTLPGDHLSAYYDQASGDVDASLRISDLKHASYTKLPDTGNGGGFEAQLNMGNQGAFAFGAEAHVTQGDVKASGAFDNLPSQVTLRSEGGHITYTGNSNPTLTLAVEAGKAAAVAAVPEPTSVHGVSVRDAKVGADKAVKAKLHLTGLPTGLDVNTATGIYTMTGYHPTNGTLVVDAVLKALAPKPLSLYLTQGVPTGNPVDITFGPITTTTGADKVHRISLDYVASQPLGALHANASYDGTDEAQLDISAIPATISVDAGFGADTKTVGIDMSQNIADITASYKHVGDADFAASVHLHDVPKTVDITLGKEASDDGSTAVDAPAFTMTTSSAGMDIQAFASAEISDPVDATAAVALAVTNLGQTVTGDLAGTNLHITSVPATTEFALQAAARVQKSVSLNWDGGIFQNTGHLDIDLKIHRITLGLTAFSDVNLRLGFTTGLDGTFGSFTFGQDSDLDIGIQDTFAVHIDWPWPFGEDDINLIKIDPQTLHLGNIAPRWHINSNTTGEIFHIPFFPFVIGECSVVFTARPKPGYTTPGNTFTLYAPPNDGTGTPAWLMTPDVSLLGLSLPDFALDIVAFFMSPYGHGIDAYPSCYTYDIF